MLIQVTAENVGDAFLGTQCISVCVCVTMRAQAGGGVLNSLSKAIIM